MYAVPDDIELNQKVNTTKSAPQNNERSHRQEYGEEVERYEKPSNLKITANTKTKKPLVPPTYGTGTSHKTQSNQTDDERIYQPLVPPKTYKKPQDLAFETREPEGRVQVNNSEGQYEVVARKEEVNAYEPLSFGGSGCEEGAYVPATHLPGGGVKYLPTARDHTYMRLNCLWIKLTIKLTIQCVEHF